MTNEGFLRLFEAMMDRAYEDLESKDETIRKDAEDFINAMKERYGNM